MKCSKGKIESYAGGGTYNIRTTENLYLADGRGWARLTKAQARLLANRLLKWSEKK